MIINKKPFLKVGDIVTFYTLFMIGSYAEVLDIWEDDFGGLPTYNLRDCATGQRWTFTPTQGGIREGTYITPYEGSDLYNDIKEAM